MEYVSDKYTPTCKLYVKSVGRIFHGKFQYYPYNREAARQTAVASCYSRGHDT